MSFSANKNLPKNKAITLVRLRPRIRVTGWISDIAAPDIYRATWSENVYGLMVDSATDYLQEAASENECEDTPNTYFVNAPGKAIVLNSPAVNPNEAMVIVEWDVHLASRDLRWFKNPMDANSGNRFWSGGIVSAPAPTQGNQDLIFGYSPIQSTGISVQVADGFLMPYLHSWSLYGSPIKVWQCIGELKAENISELFVGTGGDMNMQDGVLEIGVQDPLRLLDGKWAGDTFVMDDFSALDPIASGWPIREVFGFLPTFLPVNIDFPSIGGPTIYTNRKWVVQKGTLLNSAALQTIIDWGPGVNNAFTTRVVDASHFMVGDSILITENATLKPTSITAVDYDTNTISHLGIGARAQGIVDTVARGFCSKVSIRATPEGDRREIYYDLRYGVDYTEEEFAKGTIGIHLVDNFEGGTLFPDTGYVFDPQRHRLHVSVYGKKALPKKLDGVTDFGSLAYYGGTAGHPVVILWDILTTKIPAFKDIVPLDEPAWEAMAGSFDRTIGLAVPAEQNQEFPTWKAVAQQLFQTELLRMHFKIESGLSVLTITQTGLAEGGGKAVTSHELISPGFEWEFQDIYSRLVFALNLGELREKELEIDRHSTYLYPDMESEASPLRAAAYLHRSEKSFGFQSLFSFEPDAQLVAWRVAKLIGERRGLIRAFLPRSFIEESIDDNASVQLERLTGFPVTAQTKIRNYKLTQHQKSAEGVRVILDDQKGIQDSGRWE